MLPLSFLSLLSHCSFTCFFCFIIIPTPPVQGRGGSGSQELDQFLKCNSTRYNCGEIRDVGYPFWGKDRPEECGHPSFHLNCDDVGKETTIVIDSVSLRVLEVTKYTMKIARTDLLNDECPRNATWPVAPDGAFSYFPDVENATLHFGQCHFPPEKATPDYARRLAFGCRRRGVVVTNVTVSFLSMGPDAVECDDGASEMSVPISKLGLFGELEKNDTSTNVLDVLNQGVTMWYNGSIENCLACEKTDGVCWRNTSLVGEPTCLCGDGIVPYFCGFAGQGLGRGTRLLIGLTIGAVGAVLMFATIFYCKTKSEFLKTSMINRNIETFIKDSGPLALRRYRFAEIKKMTNSFEVKLGQGGYGEVYKGELQEGQLVAVKLLTISKGNGEDFINEVASISRTSHVNIVNLLGFCLEGRKRVLVYEFMPSGSLDKFIHNNAPGSLTWENLYQIALGTARGLEYLHKGCNTKILHFDIKPHNILLDECFRPKISDFGLAKLCLNKESIISISQARGTVGYLAPEISNKNFGGISHKSDVYSYGMMLIDMVGGRYNTNNVETKSASENYFPDWIYNKLEEERSLGSNGTYNIDENGVAKRLTIVGLWCIQTFPTHRPTIGRVIEMLEGSLSSLEIPPKPILSSPPRSTAKTNATTALIKDHNSGDKELHDVSL